MMKDPDGAGVGDQLVLEFWGFGVLGGGSFRVADAFGKRVISRSMTMSTHTTKYEYIIRYVRSTFAMCTTWI